MTLDNRLGPVSNAQQSHKLIDSIGNEKKADKIPNRSKTTAVPATIIDGLEMGTDPQLNPKGKCGPNDVKRANGTGRCALEAVQQCLSNVGHMTSLQQSNI